MTSCSAQRLEGSFYNQTEAQRPKLALMGSANTINPSHDVRKAPGGIYPLLQGLGGYTQRVRSRAPTEASSTKHHPTRSCCKLSLIKTSKRALTLSLRLGGYYRIPQKEVP